MALDEEFIIAKMVRVTRCQFPDSSVFILNTTSKMIPLNTDSQHRFRTYITDNFHQLKGAYYINSECIFTENRIVNILGNYDLLDFLDDGEFRLSTVKFLNASVNANELRINIFDIDSRKTLHRTHCLNDNTIACDWLLIAKDYFKDDLLEFEF